MKHIGFAKMLGLRREFKGISVAFPPRISIVTVVQLGFFIGVSPTFFYFIGVLLVILLDEFHRIFYKEIHREFKEKFHSEFL